MKIALNGDPYEIAEPVTVSALLAQLEVDPRRVAVEHNLVVLKRATFDDIVVNEGDQNRNRQLRRGRLIVITLSSRGSFSGVVSRRARA